MTTIEDMIQAYDPSRRKTIAEMTDDQDRAAAVADTRSPAETLLAAADRLKAVREAAPAGPWFVDDEDEIWADDTSWVGDAGQLAEGVSDYLATMSPTVAQALEALLRQAARDWDHVTNIDVVWPEALTLARAILGEVDHG